MNTLVSAREDPSSVKSEFIMGCMFSEGSSVQPNCGDGSGLRSVKRESVKNKIDAAFVEREQTRSNFA